MSSGPGASYVIFEQRFGLVEAERIRQLTKNEMSKNPALKYREAWFIVRNREHPETDPKNTAGVGLKPD